MHWKLIALLPVISLATTIPAYALNNNQTHKSTTATTHMVQNSQHSSTMKTAKAVRKVNVKPESNHVVKRTTVIKLGSKGDAVKNVQNLLKQKGFYTANVNGIFDKNTRLAVIKFQKSKGLRADGIIGSKTLAALQ